MAVIVKNEGQWHRAKHLIGAVVLLLRVFWMLNVHAVNTINNEPLEHVDIGIRTENDLCVGLLCKHLAEGFHVQAHRYTAQVLLRKNLPQFMPNNFSECLRSAWVHHEAVGMKLPIPRLALTSLEILQIVLL